MRWIIQFLNYLIKKINFNVYSFRLISFNKPVVVYKLDAVHYLQTIWYVFNIAHCFESLEYYDS